MTGACLFDLDGVLVDTATYHYLAWKRLAEELGFAFSERDNERLKGVSRMASLDLLLAAGGIEGLSDGDKQRLAEKKNSWYVGYIKQMTPADVLPGVLDFLSQLRKRRIRTAIGSASKNAPLILERVGIAALFDAVIDGRHTAKAKPDPDVFLLAAAAVRVPPPDCVVFEDAAAGVEAALQAGMRCVGVGDAGVLQRATVVIPGFAQVKWDVLERQLAGREGK
ncbi:MAG: beta-phosphoglucomutase [Prevotellaceae bacterium]|jgi:beta-phosphoglucomutase|nr:beta-phosphoglucomutase [Prevotellaceae bacterium]